jgi:3-carboxy-cis,cis-muconate cycloisomerase
LPSDDGAAGLFAPIFVSDAVAATTSDRAWLQAMLDAEAALAWAEADVGVVPRTAADAIAAACRAEAFDVDELGRAARAGGNPAIPMVAALRARVAGDAAGFVHWGATSQDVIDTAAMLVVARTLGVMGPDLDGLAAGAARLAEAHRDTPMVARTLLQHALPTTFGLKAAGWLTAVLEARRRVAWVRTERLAVQLGGAAGTLASLGADGPAVVERFGARLGLRAPLLPWHTDRTRVAEVAGVLGEVAGVVGKVALDVVLLSQTEVGEVAEPAAPGRGASSTLPHKRNPVGAASMDAAVRRAHAMVGVLLGSMVQPHERAAGAWQAEWPALTELLALTGGAVAHGRDVVCGLEVDAARMRENLERTGGVVLAERVALHLAAVLGRDEARHRTEAASARARAAGRSLADELRADPDLRLDDGQIADLTDPGGYLGSAPAFVDAALAAYRRETSRA